MDKKDFVFLLKVVSIELIVMSLIGGSFGLAIMYFLKKDLLLGFSSGGVVGVMLALVSVYRRIKRYTHND